MTSLRRSEQRGSFDHGWLKTFHTFSFGEYYDPDFMGFSVLRVINEDRIQGGTGFPTHPHRNMEIVTYVLEGALEHKDSMGNSTVIKPGEVQRMSAGTGIRHSEFNHFRDRETHLLQIWLLPGENELAPGYEQKDFSSQIARENLVLVASQDGREGSITVHQDTNLYVGRAPNELTLNLPLLASRRGWVQMIEGEAQFLGNEKNFQRLQPGDGLAITNESQLRAECAPGAHFLFFDLP